MLTTVTTTHRSRPAEALRAALSRFRAALPVAPPPSYVEPQDDPRVAWLRRLDRVQAALEQARADLVEQGWTQRAWFAVDTGGTVRPATVAESFDLVRPTSTVGGACLVGALLRRAEDPDRATTHADVWGAVDELYEALHERMGHHAMPPGRVDTHARRHDKLGVLTAWNDERTTRREDVLDLLDRAVSRTLVGACG
ncbi:hypothetical protein GCM10022197_19710 [Microlunatus spumicola]|uniref:Uncharacterized protein n=1 Tax=Microlunatus spumicola TaxID=81499 RepID=A0ABP6XBT4_9ACTN